MIKTKFFNVAKIKKQCVSAALLALCAACLVGTFASCEKSDGKTGGEQKTGEFYSLREAYDNGFITLDDLKNIAHYHNTSLKWFNSEDVADYSNYKDFTPYDIGEIDDETSLAIRTDYFNGGDASYVDEGCTVDNVWVDGYCGTYNGCIAVMMDAAYFGYATVVGEDVIEDVLLYYSDSNRVTVWKEKI